MTVAAVGAGRELQELLIPPYLLSFSLFFHLFIPLMSIVEVHDKKWTVSCVEGELKINQTVV